MTAKIQDPIDPRGGINIIRTHATMCSERSGDPADAHITIQFSKSITTLIPISFIVSGDQIVIQLRVKP